MIFDSYTDDEDTRIRRDADGTQMSSLAFTRQRAVAAYALSVIARYGDGEKGLALVRKHIVGLDLPPERINRLREYAVHSARPHRPGWAGSFPDDHLVTWECAGCHTYGEWRRANRLVMRAALLILLDVPLRCPSDFRQFVEIVGCWPGALPKALQQKVLDRIQPFVTARVTGGTFNIDPAFTFDGSKPWKGYRPGDLLALAPVEGPVTKGDYILEGRFTGGRHLMRIDSVGRRHFVTALPGFRGTCPIKRNEWIVRYRVTNRFPMRQEEAAQ
ncbi:hypothetical protein [Enhydrobacter sp.]|jgi:hypothetical protein|uniref:hypothetical protein n=1 Tax=Enhydrobacter sp. TaxID=1894999 RepID=UPI002616CFC2|nr:hypothetical protein [Enhydrobacter sp.]WIM10050.1 MAG: hypothetical protein OJF58_001003 [Enhydrobacter sp.]